MTIRIPGDPEWEGWLGARARAAIATSRLAAPRRYALALPPSRGNPTERAHQCADAYRRAGGVATGYVFASPGARARTVTSLMEEDPELAICSAAGFVAATTPKQVTAMVRADPHRFMGHHFASDLRHAATWIGGADPDGMRHSRLPLPNPGHAQALRGTGVDLEETGTRTRGLHHLIWTITGVGRFTGVAEEDMYQWRHDRGRTFTSGVMARALDGPIGGERLCVLHVMPLLRAATREPRAHGGGRIAGLPRNWQSMDPGPGLIEEHLASLVYAPGAENHVVLDGTGAFRDQAVARWMSQVAPPHRRWVVTGNAASARRWQGENPDAARFVADLDEVRPGVAWAERRTVAWTPVTPRPRPRRPGAPR